MNRYPHEKEKIEKHRPPLWYWPAIDKSLFPEMRIYLENRNLSFDDARACQWYPSTDAMDKHRRIVIPAAMSRKSGIYWQARAIDDVEPRYQSPYVDREDALVILSVRNSDRPRSLVITEGPMDALAALPYVDVSIALMGNSPSEKVWLALRDLCAYWREGGLRKIVLLGDCDAAEAPARWLVMLYDFHPHVVFPREKDFAACTLKQRKALLAR